MHVGHTFDGFLDWQMLPHAVDDFFPTPVEAVAGFMDSRNVLSDYRSMNGWNNELSVTDTNLNIYGAHVSLCYYLTPDIVILFQCKGGFVKMNIKMLKLLAGLLLTVLIIFLMVRFESPTPIPQKYSNYIGFWHCEKNGEIIINKYGIGDIFFMYDLEQGHTMTIRYPSSSIRINDEIIHVDMSKYFKIINEYLKITKPPYKIKEVGDKMFMEINNVSCYKNL